MLLNYLYKNFLEERDFAAHCAISAEDLKDLYARRIFPSPSHTYCVNGEVTSFFKPYQDIGTYRFQLKGHSRWHDNLTRLGITDETSARTYFEACFNGAKEIFLSSSLGSRLCNAAPAVSALFNAQHGTATWNHFLNGTFGVCTRDGLPETIFLKQAGVRYVEALTSDPGFGNNPDDLDLLSRLVDLLDEVESDFAPHEVAQSSRQRCIVDIRNRYLSNEGSLRP